MPDPITDPLEKHIVEEAAKRGIRVTNWRRVNSAGEILDWMNGLEGEDREVLKRPILHRGGPGLITAVWIEHPPCVGMGTTVGHVTYAPYTSCGTASSNTTIYWDWTAL